MINWKTFKELIGNGKRKYISRAGVNQREKFHFVSYNKETKDVTLMNIRNIRTLTVLPLNYFIEDFRLDRIAEDEKPLF